MFALGFVSVFDQILDSFDQGEKAKVFDAYVQALGEDPKRYRVSHDGTLDESWQMSHGRWFMAQWSRKMRMRSSDSGLTAERLVGDGRWISMMEGTLTVSAATAVVIPAAAAPKDVGCSRMFGHKQLMAGKRTLFWRQQSSSAVWDEAQTSERTEGGCRQRFLQQPLVEVQ